MKQPAKVPKSRTPSARSDAVAFLDDLFGHEADWKPLVERARVNRDVAHALHELRTAHGLTQRQLAELIGTTQSVIARLEDADYEGHSLSMLSRIAAALGQRVTVAFVPLGDATPHAQDAPRSHARSRTAVHAEEASTRGVGTSTGAPAHGRSAARASGRAAESGNGCSTSAKAKRPSTEKGESAVRTGTRRTGRAAGKP